jgi:hypothetical protein
MQPHAQQLEITMNKRGFIAAVLGLAVALGVLLTAPGASRQSASAFAVASLSPSELTAASAPLPVAPSPDTN